MDKISGNGSDSQGQLTLQNVEPFFSSPVEYEEKLVEICRRLREILDACDREAEACGTV